MGEGVRACHSVFVWFRIALIHECITSASHRIQAFTYSLWIPDFGSLLRVTALFDPLRVTRIGVSPSELHAHSFIIFLLHST